MPAYAAGMRYLRVGALCFAALAASGCGFVHSFQQGFKSSFHSNFRSSYKTGFLKSCEHNGVSSATCECYIDALERKYDDKQLMAMSESPDEGKHALDDVMRECANR